MVEKILKDCFIKKEIPLAYFLIEKMKKSNTKPTIFMGKSTFYNTNIHIKSYVFYKKIN